MSTSKRKSKVKLVGVFVIIAGALMVVAAGVTLGTVSAELKSEHQAAGARTPGSTGSAGEGPIAGPFNAYVPSVMHQGDGGEVLALTDTHNSLTNGSFLRALLSIAAVALGIAAPVMGIGVLFALGGLGPLKGSHRR